MSASTPSPRRSTRSSGSRPNQRASAWRWWTMSAVAVPAKTPADHLVHGEGGRAARLDRHPGVHPEVAAPTPRAGRVHLHHRLGDRGRIGGEPDRLAARGPPLGGGPLRARRPAPRGAPRTRAKPRRPPAAARSCGARPAGRPKHGAPAARAHDAGQRGRGGRDGQPARDAPRRERGPRAPPGRPVPTPENADSLSVHRIRPLASRDEAVTIPLPGRGKFPGNGGLK